MLNGNTYSYRPGKKGEKKMRGSQEDAPPYHNYSCKKGEKKMRGSQEDADGNLFQQ